MLCQRCQKNQANTHVKNIVNGKLTEYSLCSQCAHELGYDHLGLISQFNFSDILGSLFDQKPLADAEVRCKGCGASFSDITKSGKVGCMECYETFYDKLIPMIQRIHGTTVHKGKTPGRSALTVQDNKNEIKISDTSILEQKKLQLKNAVSEQRFEDAAELRDEIKEMESNE